MEEKIVTTLIIREVYIKTTMKYHCASVRMFKIKGEMIVSDVDKEVG
jgi:hypothetical protein